MKSNLADNRGTPSISLKVEIPQTFHLQYSIRIDFKATLLHVTATFTSKVSWILSPLKLSHLTLERIPCGQAAMLLRLVGYMMNTLAKDFSQESADLGFEKTTNSYFLRISTRCYAGFRKWLLPCLCRWHTRQERNWCRTAQLGVLRFSPSAWQG